MVRTAGELALAPSRVEERDRLLLCETAARFADSMSWLARFRGRRTGLKERLPSGVVGAVEDSKRTGSSASTADPGTGSAVDMAG